MGGNIAFFVFTLLCISSHACNAQPLCDLDNNVQHGTQLPNKNYDNESRVNNNICIDIITSKIVEATRSSSTEGTSWELNDKCKINIMHAEQAITLHEEDERERLVSVDQNDEVIIISGRKLLHQLTESKDDYDYPDYPKPQTHPPQHN